MAWHAFLSTPVGTTWASEDHPFILIHQEREKYTVHLRHPAVEKRRHAPTWADAERDADELRLALAPHLDSRPVVHRPDSVTHWTCPDDADGDTHHIGRSGTCITCGKPQDLLRAEQAALTAAGVRLA
jgi:hypothetical protein